jgi:hypothetical protein
MSGSAPGGWSSGLALPHGAAGSRSSLGKRDAAHGPTFRLIFTQQKGYYSSKSLYISFSAALFRS